jgi:AraC-like DNA-binding protein
MFRFQEIPPEGDPSSRIQEFREVLPKLLCCRYWWMSEWKSQQMAFPFWRLYWNRSGKAKVVYNKTIYLDPGKILLIPPNTPFASDIEETEVDPDQLYSLRGGRVESEEMEQEMITRGRVLHLFVHFTLGYPFDTITPDIFVFDLQPGQKFLINSITRDLMDGQVIFNQAGSLQLYSLLFSVLYQLPSNVWNSRKLDNRVISGIRFMDQNIREPVISNKSLAVQVGMSVNAYARHFKNQTGVSPRRYLSRMRIEKACNLLHHSELSIEQIASACGFSDRYYFTRVFKKHMKTSPGVYRKNSVLGR